ncbi:MAG: helix-turn-helix domain-containing protein [Rhodospirillaceae bacterium]
MAVLWGTMQVFGKQDQTPDAKPYLKFGGAGDAGAPPASTVGTLLCATRMRVGKDLQRVAEVLHIRYTYLVAIEDGRYEDLPGQAYAIGFVRAYADHLGLDGDEVVRRYKEESAGVTRKALFDFPLPTPDSGLPSGALILLAMVVGMGVYASWYFLAGSDRSAIDIVQAVPDRLVTLATPDAPAEAKTDPAEAPPETTITAEAPPAEIVPEVKAPPAPVDVVELRSKADMWVTLRDTQKVDHTQFLKKGEVFRVADAHGMTLLASKANDLEVLVNGKVMVWSDEGVFTRGLPLDPEHLPEHLKAAPPS